MVIDNGTGERKSSFTPTKMGSGRGFSHAEGGNTKRFWVLTLALEVLSMLKGGTTNFHPLKGGGRKVLPWLEGGRKSFWTRDFSILVLPPPCN